ncbi:MAG: hypothetical protein M0Q46_06195 [Endomicrobiales bacterium]|nr:hypothetical protein [Endomicrobiales bacterium]
MSGEVGKIWITLEANSAAFMKAMDEADKKFSKTKEAAEQIGTSVRNMGLAMGVFGVAIVGAMILAVTHLTKTSDELDEMSMRTGVGTKALQELGYVAKLSGGSMESMETAFKKMAMSITAAGDGVKGSQDDLQKLNLTFSDLAGLTPEEQFNTIAGALSDIKNPTERAALAVSLFGRSGTSILPMLEGGREGMAKMRSEAEKLGAVIDEKTVKAASQLNDEFAKVMTGIRGLWNSLAISLLPTVIEFTEKAKTLVIAVRGWITTHEALFSSVVKIVAVIGGLAIVFGGLMTVVGSFMIIAPLLGTAFTMALGPIGLITVALGALIAGGILLIANWNWVKYVTIQSWQFIKAVVLNSILDMLQGLNVLIGWIPIYGEQLKSAMENVQKQIETVDKQYAENKANFQTEENKKELERLKKIENEKLKAKLEALAKLQEKEERKAAEAEAARAEQRKIISARISKEETNLQKGLQASWAKYTRENSEIVFDWGVVIQNTIGNLTASLSAGFNVMFSSIGNGWDGLSQGMQAIGDVLRNALIGQLADMMAKQVIIWATGKQAMAALTIIWKNIEVAANAAVGAAAAAAATAWTLWGAIAIGAAIGAAILAFGGKFTRGGVVGGTSYAGDNVLAAVNSGEMILNQGQQARLFDMANGRTENNSNSQTFSVGDIIINGDVDGNNINRIAKQLKEAVKSGQIEAIAMAKSMTKIGISRSGEAY